MDIENIDISFGELESRMEQHILSNSKSNECIPFFSDSNRNLVKAMLLFYLNSGCGRFQQWKEYDLSCNDSPLVVEELLEEIEKETVTDEEMKNTLLKFLEAHSYTNTNVFSCGACGIREIESPENKFERFPLSSTGQLKSLQFGPESKKALDIEPKSITMQL